MNNTALYIRLSKEDSKNNTSESVENQKSLLLKYLNDNNYNLYKIYIDDGFTGTNFDRPGFKEMINDIKLKKTNIVIVKDLSRLGRDYVSVGYYIENWFPKNNIRFISVLDNIDTQKEKEENELLPFKSIFNDLYSKENSRKIRAALRTKQELGKWVGGCPPFGYKTTKKDKNKLIENKEESIIVKKIFSLFLLGNSLNKISKILYERHISPPSVLRHIDKKNKYAQVGYWSPTTIKNILKNPLYTGDLIQNRRRRISYKIRKIINNKKNEWIIVKNTHKAIVSREDYEDAQRILKYNSNIKSNKKEQFLLDGILYCKECSKRIVIQKNKNNYYTICNNYKKYSKLKICTSHSNNYYKIEERIKCIIVKVISKISINKLYKKIINRFEIKKTNNSNEEKINRLNEMIEKCYIDSLNNRISQDLYEKTTKNLKKEIVNIENKINKNNKIDYEYIEKKLKTINRELIIKLVEKIQIHNDKSIDIFWNFFNNDFITNK